MNERVEGVFITLEGIEGCGKSTQGALLSGFLVERGLPVLTTKEPGGTRIGGEIRKILLDVRNTDMVPACEALLYLADRAQHVHQQLRPELASGTWVVCDRYQDSTLAYQGAARGLDLDRLVDLFDWATGNLKPDMTLLLDLDPEIGLQRARGRNEGHGMVDAEGRFEAEHMAFHGAVRSYFLQLADKEPDRFRVLDADRPVDTIAREIRRIVEAFLV